MATIRFIANAVTRAQVNTVTPANVGIGNTFTVTINGKAITFTATAGTVANVTAGLVALLNASTDGEFAEITWTDSTTHITATAATPGKPFTQTSSASGGTATLTTATTVTNSSPNDANTAANYSGGSLPTGNDTLIFENTDASLLYSLGNLSAITLNTLRVEPSYTGEIGLPEFNEGGFYEYRPTYFAISAGNVTINGGAGRIKLNTGNITANINVLNTGSPLESGVESLLWKGGNGTTTNVLNVTKGSVGVAIFAGEAATLPTWRSGYTTSVDSDVAIRFGSGVTLTTGNQDGGVVEINSAITTVNKYGGTLIHKGGAITTLTNVSGLVVYLSEGTITTYIGAGGSHLDCSQDMRARTITNCDVYAGAQISDPFKTVTWSNGIDLNYCGLGDVTLSVGENVKVTPATL